MDWAKADTPLKDWICVYTQKNSVVFFARYPGKACGYDYSLLTLTSRANHDSVEFEQINQGFVLKNEIRPVGVMNELSGAVARTQVVEDGLYTANDSVINI